MTYAKLNWIVLVVVFLATSSGLLKSQEIGVTLYIEPDSLTLFVPGDAGAVSMEGFGFEVVINDERQTFFLDQYSTFRNLRFSSIPTPICFRIERNGSRTPLPLACQQNNRILTHLVPDADIFWYDENARQARTLLLVQLSAPIDFCPSGQFTCNLSYIPPAVAAPISTLEGAVITRDFFSYEIVSANVDWTIVLQDFDGIEMVLVPPGCFLMGSSLQELEFAERLCIASAGTDACQRINFHNETPQTRLCFENPFWIDRYEVSGEQYGSTGYFTNLDGPREMVTWFEAYEFCDKRGARLPNEMEWEYAARGPTGFIYPWGNEFIVRNVIYKNNSSNRTTNVIRNESGASWVGAQHMSGNVWEWTNSIFLDYPYDILEDRESYNEGSVRIIRGGSWGDGDSIVRAAYRGRAAPEYKDQYIGFRCVRDYEEE